MGAIPFPTVESRINRAAEVLKVPKEEVEKVLSDDFGIESNEEGLSLLDAQTTTESFLVETLSHINWPKLKLLAVAAILKGKDPFAKAEETKPEPTKPSSQVLPEVSVIAQAVAEITKGFRDPKQMKDRELLEIYDKERDYEIEQELHRRGAYQFWVVLKPEASDKDGKKAIDIEMSLDLLKRSRRMVNPSLVRQGDVFVNVYRITELNPEDQIVEICPFCGDILYKGYCEKCNADMSACGNEEKAYIKLITELGSFNRQSKSDRDAVLISAGKGVADLRKTWPGVWKRFEELKLLNDLPKLRKSKNLPSQRPADPFHIK